MKPQLTIEAFADWCEKQPADKVYNWCAHHECACGQYAASLGITGWCEKVLSAGFWDQANSLAFDVSHPKTFGKLAARLRAVQS